MKHIFLLIFLFLLCLSANAYSVEEKYYTYGSVTYVIRCNHSSIKQEPIANYAFVVAKNYTGTIRIPKTITYFYGSGESVELRVCLTENSFQECNSLKTIYVDEGVYFVKKVETYPTTFSSNDYRSWILVRSVFDKCESLSYLKLNGVYGPCIKAKAYSSDKSYKLLRCFPTYNGKNETLLDDVNEITEYAFRNCVNIDSITIPAHTHIARYAFLNCKNLSYADFNPHNCEYGAFQGTNITKIIVDNFEPYESASNDKIIINIGNDEVGGNGAQVYNLRKDYIYIKDSIISQSTFFINNNILNPLGIKVDSIIYNDVCYVPHDSILTIKNSFNSYTFNVYTKILNKYYKLEYNVKRRPNVILNALKATQSTITFSTNAEETEDAVIESITTKRWGYVQESSIKNGGICTIDKLPWNSTIKIEAIIKYKDIDGYCFQYADFQTQPLSLEASTKATPTSIHSIALFDKGDANIGKIEITLDGITYETSDLYANNLTLRSTHTLILRAYDKYNNYYSEKKYNVTLPIPALTTIKEAKSISNTTAVICAKTNLDDLETTAGFEWRRYDAPELVPSTKANCPIIDGVMMGALKNLSTNTYYKFRPFYTAKDGTEYYGDWSAFGTADAYVYFDPTVRTYNVNNIDDNHVTARGYAIAGSDPIIEQGFEYWECSSESSSTKRLLSESNKQIVKAEGQWMTATIDNLIGGRNYAIRAFVKTAKETTYGETQTFTTTNTTGIGNVFGIKETLDLRIISQSHNVITLNLSGIQNEGQYQLFNINGLKVCSGVLNSTSNIQQIQTPNLSTGIYLLKVSDSKQSKVMRVIIR